MKRSFTILIGAATIAVTQPALASSFDVVSCTGLLRERGVAEPLTMLYRVGDRETQVWDAAAGVWRRSGCAASGACVIDDRHVDVDDSYLSEGRGFIRHYLDIDRPSGRLVEYWPVRQSDDIRFDATCRSAPDPAPGAEGVAPHYGRGHYPSDDALPHGYPLPMTRSRFERRFPGLEVKSWKREPEPGRVY